MIVRTYVLTTDAGSAPNFEAPLTTLAICKPRLRRAAQPGDVVLAFNGATVRTATGNRRFAPDTVRWAGVVSETLSFAEYWNDRRFIGKRPGRSTRPDNLYRATPAGLVQEPNQMHGATDADRDLGGLNVLVLARSWYFADSAPDLPRAFGLHQHARRSEPMYHLHPTIGAALLGWLDAQPVFHAVASDEAPRVCTPARQQERPASCC